MYFVEYLKIDVQMNVKNLSCGDTIIIENI